MHKYPKVAVVIIHWNKVEYLQKFLPSVVASIYPNLEIVLADNHSSDDSIKFIEENYNKIGNCNSYKNANRKDKKFFLH
jgi:glycosyltransferase involved in cell wall biosynthesis